MAKTSSGYKGNQARVDMIQSDTAESEGAGWGLWVSKWFAGEAGGQEVEVGHSRLNRAVLTLARWILKQSGAAKRQEVSRAHSC